MTPITKTTSEPTAGAGDASADLIRDISKDPPPKDLETVKAASNAVESETHQSPDATRRARIERRAYELWEADGGEHGRHEDYWRRAEGEIAREEG